MLYLITGLPGAGKTLYAVSWIPKEFGSRPIFYSGIKDLRLPWVETTPEKWPELPDGSVVVIDEAQKHFRVRAPGSRVPDHVAALETHRHRGFDIVVITQHPQLLDTNVRRLVGRHVHVRRTWGMKTAALFTWDEVANPEEKGDLTQAVKSRWLYDESAFNAYHSAELHTHKRRVPSKVWFAAFLVVGLGVLGWRVVGWINDKTHQGTELVEAAKAKVIAGPTSEGHSRDRKRGPTTGAEWLAERLPLVPEEPASAVRYASLTAPVRAPRVAGCIQTREGAFGRPGECRCFTQQGTVAVVPPERCEAQMQSRVFDDWGPGGDSGWRNDEGLLSGPSAVGGRDGETQSQAPSVQPQRPVS
jgi:hypothetical protein